MARTIKFTKEEIMEKSIQFIKEYGYSKLSVRELAKYIGCSTQPIFKNYDNFDSYKEDLKTYLRKDYNKFIDGYVNKENYLYTISCAYALYAKKEPKIFNSLFMEDLAGSRTIEEVLKSNHNIATIESIPKQYGISKKQAEKLYRDIRFYTHGLACQIACNSILITEEEIKKYIKETIEKLK